MQLSNHPSFHLTYCTNIHPGEKWDQVFQQLKTHVPGLKKRLAPQQPFGIGLRLSAQAAATLRSDNKLNEFKDWLADEDCYVFTMNGFPYGNFHRQRVKDLVYTPDWRTEERVEYTINLAHILAELLPNDVEGGISTSPISYKYWLQQPCLEEQAFRKGSINLARVAALLADIREEHGKLIHIDIEPEPDCLLENTQETVDFFTEWLFPVGAAYLMEHHNYSFEEAKQLLKDHIQLCYDTCHFAVEYEEPSEALQQIHEAGIKVGKTQISAALKVILPEAAKDRQSIQKELQKFEESTYLHQVVERRTDGSINQYRDLDTALPHIFDSDAREWRIHYHVPIFIDQFNQLTSTQEDISKSLDFLKENNLCQHFEIETYTWDVLPEELKKTPVDSIEREFEWVLTEFNKD
ncbi:metabolite traffic protein EboE [Fodinibius salsisoli]|uniref:Metabolite traffic protein EboE n=1 Tax=Fodinibius salsisoli TaxID=2820877 RepID=A0ABT3PPP0_9BACT|nr:metabolite traffic protein EboE [Fodinibius salsisoli]MCW9707805.1 metabolite traffic protein EboE [Fodinibius salsisoli]